MITKISFNWATDFTLFHGKYLSLKLRHHHAHSKQAFLEPQKVKVDFIELSTKEIAKSIKVNDKDLSNLYEEEQARFSTEELHTLEC
jgi:hypothetical protein